MSDRNLPRELKRWATEEFTLPAKSLPHDGYFKTLCFGPGASIWKYITQHVYQHRNVRVMRGNLQWYRVLQDKELQELEGQGEAARRQELQQQVQELRGELSHLESQISLSETQLASEERSAGRSSEAAEGDRRRELLLRAFRGRCAQERCALANDARRISGHSQALEQLSKKAEVEVVFGNGTSLSSSEEDLSPAVAEPQVLREVRGLCEQRLQFLRTLEESELKTGPPGTSPMTREERMAEHQAWLRAVEELLRGYPPDQVLLALQHLALLQERTLRQHLALLQERTLRQQLASQDGGRDSDARRIVYESNHRLDISRQEEEALPSVKTLLGEAWEDVEGILAELSQAHYRTQQLHSQVRALRKNPGGEGGSNTQVLLQCACCECASEAELQAVRRAAVRDSLRDQCRQLEQRARDRQKAVQNLRGQRQSILDFRQVLVARQEIIRELIRDNSSTRAQLTYQHHQIGQFLHTSLAPLFGDVIAAAKSQRNAVSQEARHFSAVSLAALDSRVVDGEQRIPVSMLSIHRLHSPSFHGLCQSLAFPLYKAPEEMWVQVLSQHVELRHLRQLLQLHSSSLENVQRRGALLPAPDHQALLSRVAEEDQALLETLLPRVRQLSVHCAQALAYTKQVQTAIGHWWDQPAQAALPEMCQDGMTFQQWLRRWKLAAQGVLPKA